MSGLKTYSVTIFGQPFTLVSDESSKEVEKIASGVDELMRRIADESGVSDIKKVSVLAIVKLLCEVRELEQSNNKISVACQRLVELADAVL